LVQLIQSIEELEDPWLRYVIEHIQPDFVRFHQTHIASIAQLLGHVGLARVQQRGEMTDTRVRLAQRKQKAQACGMRQRFQEAYAMMVGWYRCTHRLIQLSEYILADVSQKYV